MRFTILLMAILPLVLGAKELLGEELPSKEGPDDASMTDDKDRDEAMMVKRSVGNIATRRRSALDKNFMRFGRSDPSMEKTDRSGRAKQDFMRFGRARSSHIMRFGRSPSNFMRFGRGSNNLMRFGRANLMRFGRANLMRFGRGGNNLMRFGRANLMRFGRSSDDFLDDPEDLNEDENVEDEPSEEMTRKDINDRLSTYLNDRIYEEPKDRKEAPTKYYDDNFMRFGRMTTDNPIEDDQFDLLFPEDRPLEERSS